jgi:parvulin-like peptidyl-prolyl isomerase
MRAPSRSAVALAATCTLLAACDGLKEALTAHVDVVARAGSQELSVERLANLMGNAKIQIPPTRENTKIVADLWAGYQQLAYAAAHSDSLGDKKLIDEAVRPILNASREQKFMQQIVSSYKADSGSEAEYNQAAGGLLAARHILLSFPPAATATQKDSVRKRAETIRAQVTTANFTDMAKKYSGDPGVAQNSGNYGVFPREQMVSEFSNATAALKPGEISAPVASQFGYHIIQRLTYPEVKAEFAQKHAELSRGKSDSVYMSQLDSSAKFEVKANAVSAVKSAAQEPEKHWKDNTTLVTFKGGEMTVGEFLDWVQMLPPQQRIMQQIPTAPDSLLKPFIKNMAQREVILLRADSAKVDVTPEERTQLYNDFQQLVVRMWQGIDVDPKSLADSAKNTPERERLAAARVERYLDNVLAGQAQPVPVPVPLKKILDGKYEASVNSAGVDRAVERAQKVRQVADSARAANQPKSQIPLPGMPPGGAAPVQPQPTPPPATQPAPPAPKKP